jgi:large subunit ribosomal protein L30
MAEKKTTGATKTQSKHATKRLRVTYVKSAIGYNVKQKQTIEALGLRRLQQVITHPDTPAVRGMLNKVSHLVRVEEVEEAAR